MSTELLAGIAALEALGAVVLALRRGWAHAAILASWATLAAAALAVR